MIEVKNRKTIRNLSKKILKASRVRNIVAICAIALTTILFTALFTIGGSMIDSMQLSTMKQVGTRAHAGFKGLTKQQYDILKEDPKIKDISYDIIVAIAENKELQKVHTEIRYSEEKNAKWSFCMPTTGTLPKEKYDLATSTQVLDALGVAHKLGEKVTLEFTAHGHAYKQEFTLCGFWSGAIAFGAHEAYISREYCDEVAPVLTVPMYESGSDEYAGGINPSLWFSSSWDIEQKMQELIERCNFDSRVNAGVNWAYTTSKVDATSIVLIVFLLLLILLSGYLLIYNIFQISVSRDIRFYGLLKTIGTTPKQLKRIVLQQALWLGSIGITAGVVLGYGIGCILMPTIIQSTSVSDSISISVNPFIFLGAVIFSLLTVYLSCIKPCKMAAKVSPVEAMRYTGVKSSKVKNKKTAKKLTPFSMAWATLNRDKKKTFIVILSLCLSLVLLNGTYVLVNGFDIEKYVEQSSVTDFTIKDGSIYDVMSTEKVLDGVTDSVMEQIRNLKGLEKIGAVWSVPGVHSLSMQGYERTLQIVEKNKEEFPSPYADEYLRMLNEDHEIMDMIYGIDETLLDKLEMGKGQTVDKEKFLSGNYVIVTAFWDTGEDAFYKPGDIVSLDFGNGKSKDYTVLALGDIPYALSQGYSSVLDIHFILPSSEYKAQMGKTNPMSVGFNVSSEYREDAEKWCKEYTENVETQLRYASRDTFKKEFEDTQRMFAIVGGALSFILALIGILNFSNAMITSVSVRQRELAMLKSIGMTGRQMKAMLVDEGLIYAALTVFFTVTAGSLLCYAGLKLLTQQMWFFTWHFSVFPVLCCVPFVLVIVALVPIFCYRQAEKKTVVERLRESE